MTREDLKERLEDFARQIPQGSYDEFDFYKLIVGVYGKEHDPLSCSEYFKQLEEIAALGLPYWPSSERESFLIIMKKLPQQSKNIRFYINSHNADSAISIVKAAAHDLIDRVNFQFKLVGRDNYGYSRFDNTILYVNINDAKTAAEVLLALSEKEPYLFDEDVPFTTRKIAKGIGYALTPLVCQREIFGERLKYHKYSPNFLHSLVLKRTFEEADKRGVKDPDKITGLYMQALEQAYIDPEKPYLNLGMKDPLEIP